MRHGSAGERAQQDLGQYQRQEEQHMEADQNLDCDGGRNAQSRQISMSRHVMAGVVRQPYWQVVFKGTTHCGAGCTLGDIIGEWGIFIAAATLAGITLWPEYIADFCLAYVLGIAFQFFAIAPMRGLGLRQGIVAAVKADTLALTAFEIGLFAWMAIFTVIIFNQALRPDSPVYWFMMQIGMVIGFATSYPMNWWLISKGIKEKM
jgi:hypothetical protein